jgi:chromosome segregation ATPase
LHAHDKFEALIQKVDECSVELEEAKQHFQKLVTQFEDVKTRKKQLFEVFIYFCFSIVLLMLAGLMQNCFTHISTNLSKIYKDLTKTPQHPMGKLIYYFIH